MNNTRHAYGALTPDGLNLYCNGRLTRLRASMLGLSVSGCQFRGTTVCHQCPYASRIPVECDYQCDRCAHHHICPCGQDGQEIRVEAILATEGVFIP
jgi:hypothetical protein